MATSGSTRTTLISPFQYFADPTRARPIFNGFIFIGRVDGDPTNTADQIPVQVICECGGSPVNVTQPIRTGPGGLPIYNGSPAQIVVCRSNYSITLQDNNRVQVYHSPNVQSGFVNQPITHTTLAAAMADDNSSRQLIRLLERGGAEYRRAANQAEYNSFPELGRFTDAASILWVIKIDDVVNPVQLGAVSSSTENSQEALQAACNVAWICNTDVVGSDAIYTLESQIVVWSNVSLIGHNLTIKRSNNYRNTGGALITVCYGYTSVNGITFDDNSNNLTIGVFPQTTPPVDQTFYFLISVLNDNGMFRTPNGLVAPPAFHQTKTDVYENQFINVCGSAVVGVGCRNVLVRDNYCNGYYDHFVYFSGSENPSDDIIIQSNQVINKLPRSGNTALKGRYNCDGWVVQGNTFDLNDGMLSWDAEGSDIPANNPGEIVLSANIVKNASYALISSFQGLSSEVSSSVKFTNNIFNLTTGFSLLRGSQDQKINIKNCIINFEDTRGVAVFAYNSQVYTLSTRNAEVFVSECEINNPISLLSSDGELPPTVIFQNNIVREGFLQVGASTRVSTGNEPRLFRLTNNRFETSDSLGRSMSITVNGNTDIEITNNTWDIASQVTIPITRNPKRYLFKNNSVYGRGVYLIATDAGVSEDSGIIEISNNTLDGNGQSSLLLSEICNTVDRQLLRSSDIVFKNNHSLNSVGGMIQTSGSQIPLYVGGNTIYTHYNLGTSVAVTYPPGSVNNIP